MRKITIFYIILFINTLNSSSQPFNYELKWKLVDSLEAAQLPKSEAPIVNDIYKNAKAEKNTVQQVKALVYKMKIAHSSEEEGQIKNIEFFEKEIQPAVFPLKPILYSMLAEMYWHYYESDRYRIQERSHAVGFEKKDIKTWDLSYFVEKVESLYKLSLADNEKSKKIKIENFKYILENINEENTLNRPTLYDFLIHRAIDFYSNNEAGLTKPISEFNINDDLYFLPTDKFIKLDIASDDSLSFSYNAIKLLQNAIRFHLNDIKPEALVDLELKRYKFIYEHLTSESKDSVYLQNLNNLKLKCKNSNSEASIELRIIQKLYDIGNQYSTQSSANRWKIKEARQKCIELSKKYDFVAEQCSSFIAKIESKDIMLNVESENLPDEPFRALANYRNTDSIYFRIYKTNYSELDEITTDYTKLTENAYIQQDTFMINLFKKKKPITSYSVFVPKDSDYQNHSAEIKINALDKGIYMIMAGTSSEMDYNKGAVSFGLTSITELSYLNRQNENGGNDFYVLHRKTGQPLRNVEALCYEYNYNERTRKYDSKLTATLHSDSTGLVRVSTKEVKNNSFNITFKYNDDIWSTGNYQYLLSGSSFYNYERTNYKLKTSRIFFFTDRAIYRPGQTIYFKGIVISSDGWKENEIVPNFITNVTLKDVNWQDAGSLRLTSNEYGTFSGSFTAPSKGLNGRMTIYTSYGMLPIQVEEYKRPKFEVLFDSLKDSYKLGQTLKVPGKALAYSGANIDNATVSYRVVRQTRYPWWRDYWWFPHPESPEKEITNGTTKTDVNGNFEIDFLAEPDKNVSAASSPTFDFIVNVDITDINGETHSNNQTVSVGYNALLISTSIPQKLDKNNNNTFSIESENLSGGFVPASGKIIIEKLKGPDKVYRNRKWEKPDKFALSESEFHRYFPNDVYDDETNFSKWPSEEQVLSVNFNTLASKTLILNNLKNWKDGIYKITLQSKDKYNSKVEETFYFTLFDKSKNTIPYRTDDWFLIINSKAEPGENIKLLAGSGYENTCALLETECDNKIISSQWININNEQKTIEIPVKEEYRGNFGIHFTSVKNSRLYTHNETIIVPYTNKKLDIKFETFRNKLQPGEKEQWKLRITGKDGDKAAAEMVATLYDASLDAFQKNTFNFYIYPDYYPSMNLSGKSSFDITDCQKASYNEIQHYTFSFYDDDYYLNWFGYPFSYTIMDEPMSIDLAESANSAADNYKSTGVARAFKKEDKALKMSMAAPVANVAEKEDESSEKVDFSIIASRTNFNETAFFYPNQQTDENGDVTINFTIPEALTKWKMLGFAHTKDLKYGLIENELVTQKELMVVPNAPRFFREGDTINFSAKITSLTGQNTTGSAKLMLFDATTMKPIDKELSNNNAIQNFSIRNSQSASGSTNLSWQLIIPQGIKAITYRIVAQAGNFSDGEEMTLPVLTNRMLVTETMAISVKGKQSKTFTLEKLAKNTSSTLRSNKLTFEYTANPAWYAIQALPYLMEYPYECAEQVFSRYYANSIASHIANSNPRIKQVFDSWKNISPDALLSNLEKNQELKGLMLEETPWVLQAKDESQRKKNVALLFDLNRMGNELSKAEEKLKDIQSSNGGFPWFKGMPDDRYITQYIVCGLGKLNHLGISNLQKSKIRIITENAINYTDQRIAEDYQQLVKLAKAGQIKLSENHLDYTAIHYLYARSFFHEVNPSKETKVAIDYYTAQAKTYWTKFDVYFQGMLALALKRSNDNIAPASILKSLKERSIISEEMGMYWKFNAGWFWYQAPIETQSMMIEAFDEIANDTASVNEMRVWLLKQKQTQDWRTTKATTEACYALLLRGTNWLVNNETDEIKVGSIKLEPSKMEDVKVEAGTGYFKTSWNGSDIKPEMATVTINKKSDGVSWGALYWQYFEQLDKITSAETPLKLNKKLFIEQSSSKGPVIIPLSNTTNLKPGDLIKVRIELRVDRDMEYVHMKDMRASGFEPVNVISQYKWQDGLGYYESTRDASTNFFFNWLPKGTYVFEYPLRVNNSGNFSNGITTVQCMYAPEFTSHSEGVRVKVK